MDISERTLGPGLPSAPDTPYKSIQRNLSHEPDKQNKKSLAGISLNASVLTRCPGNPITPFSPLLSAWNVPKQKISITDDMVVWVNVHNHGHILNLLVLLLDPSRHEVPKIKTEDDIIGACVAIAPTNVSDFRDYPCVSLEQSNQ